MPPIQVEPEEYDFEIKVMDGELSTDQTRELFAEALGEAIEAASQEESATVEASAEIEGSFAGTIAIAYLIFKVVAAKAGTGFAYGTGGAAGKHFYENYLKPRLEKRSLNPSSFKKRGKS